jgi:hypothetical protein
MSTRWSNATSSEKVENQYLVGSVPPSGHSISGHSSVRGAVSLVSRCAGRTLCSTAPSSSRALARVDQRGPAPRRVPRHRPQIALHSPQIHHVEFCDSARLASNSIETAVVRTHIQVIMMGDRWCGARAKAVSLEKFSEDFGSHSHFHQIAMKGRELACQLEFGSRQSRRVSRAHTPALRRIYTRLRRPRRADPVE